MQSKVLRYFHLFAFFYFDSTVPVAYAGFGRVGAADVECQQARFMADNASSVLLAIALAVAIDAWQIVVVALHG